MKPKESYWLSALGPCKVRKLFELGEVPALLLTCCVTLGKLLPFLGLSFPSMK